MRSIRSLALVGLLAPLSVSAQGGSCKVATRGLPLAAIPEASGVAISGSRTGVLWSHNDGQPALYALGTDGSVKGRIIVAGARSGDFEAVAVGGCPHGNCVYLGDIGDNNGKRKDVTIYRFAEPGAGARETAGTESVRATYPDGPKDAEGMFVLGNGTVYIVSKGEKGPVALYRLPEFKQGSSVQLTRVATLQASDAGNGKGKKGKGKGKTDGEAAGGRSVASTRKVTDASVSPDGRWIALRTLNSVTFYRASELTSGEVREAFSYDLRSLGEAQGEGIALGPDGVVWLISEGGGKSKPGTLARLQCQLP